MGTYASTVEDNDPNVESVMTTSEDVGTIAICVLDGKEAANPPKNYL